MTQLKSELRLAQLRIETDELILNSASEGICGLDAMGVTTFFNRSAEVMTGWSAEDLLGNPQHNMLHHSYANGRKYPLSECPIMVSIREGRPCHREDEVFWRKDGSSFPVRYTSTPIKENGTRTGAVVVFQDITEQKRKEAWERSRTAVFVSITTRRPVPETLGMIADALVAYDPTWSVAILLRSGAYLTLAAEANLPTRLRAAYDLLSADDGRSACSRVAMSGKATFLDEDASIRLREERIELGETGIFQAHIVPLESASGMTIGVLALFGRGSLLAHEPAKEPLCSACDMARLAIDHQRLHEELVHRSQFDNLTGLPNGLLMADRLKQAVMQAKRKGAYVGLCWINLDRLRQINEIMGYREGDAVLERVATVLSEMLREVDTVARPGEDSFVVILPDLADPSDAEAVGERLLEHIREPFLMGNHKMMVTATAGVAVYPVDGSTDSLLLTHGQFALHSAKQEGRDRMKRYCPVIGRSMERSAAVQSALHMALVEGQFRVFYQGLFDTTRQLVGFEALLRWKHPDLGPVGPDEFIPIAEQNGMIVEIGAWVLNEACRQMKAWQTASGKNLKIFVNVSGVQLSRADFTGVVVASLERSGLAAQSLELEITESWLMKDPLAASLQLKALRALGVASAIDDFGTGHSSFSSLHKLPVDAIKIDQSFVRRLDGTAKNSATVRTIVSLARELGLATVAEGVETEEQARELQGMDCTILQGYLLARPLDAEGAGKLVGTRKPAAWDAETERAEPRHGVERAA